MIKLGNLVLPLYICPYTIPTAYQGMQFHAASNDPVMIAGYNSNYTPVQPFTIFAPSPFDYGITQCTNVYCGGNGSNYACLNGQFVGNTNANLTNITSSSYTYSYFISSYAQEGALEGLELFSGINILPTQSSGFTGAFAPYGYANPQCFPIPQVIRNILQINPTYNFCNFTGPGTGYTDAVVISTPQGNYIAPFNDMICYIQTSPSYNFQLSGLTAKFNKIMGLYPNGGQWERINWSAYQFLSAQTTPISLPSGPMFTPVTINDNTIFNSAFNNANAGTNTDPNQIMTNDYFFTVVLKNISSFSNMASTVLMIFPEKDYYINVQLVGKTAAAVAALSNANFSLQFDRRGWFMLVNPSVSETEIFNTVPLEVDFTFPPLPKNAINPLPCFNNAIEGLIVG